MDDLELLKELPGRADPPDDETKERMRAAMEARTAAGSVHRPRRSVKLSMLGIAAVLTAASLAAAVALHPWTADQPVAIPIGTTPADPGAEGTIMIRIPDPTGQISTPADLESTVAEFAPSIRLPEWGSFDVWIQRQEANPESAIGAGLDRANVVQSMVWVSQCQWGQQWLDAFASGDQAATGQALRVLGGVSDWQQAAGIGDVFLGGADLLQHMKNGDRASVQSSEQGCGYTGSWGTTPAQQDAKAKGDLSPAVQIAQQYLQDGGDPGAFDPSVAGNLAPKIMWTYSHEQPAPASPGRMFIAESAGASVTLVAVSEAGTQFCSVVTDTSVDRGTTTDDLATVEGSDGVPQAVQPGPVTCTPGGW